MQATGEASCGNARRERFGLVIPTFNRRQLVVETISFALQQKRPFDEVVLVDDGSTDGTADLVAERFPSIRVVRCRNAGVQTARNLGAETLSADWVVFCDSDDLLKPSYLLELESAVAGTTASVIYSNFVEFGDDFTSDATKLSAAPAAFLRRAQRVPFGLKLEGIEGVIALLHFRPLFPSGSGVRRRVFLSEGGYDSRLRGVKSEDLEFAMRMVAGPGVLFLVEPLVAIRKHMGNDSRDFGEVKAGEAAVLEFIVENAGWARSISNRLISEARTRRAQAFDAAYWTRRWDLARMLSMKVHWSKLDLPRMLRIARVFSSVDRR